MVCKAWFKLSKNYLLKETGNLYSLQIHLGCKILAGDDRKSYGLLQIHLIININLLIKWRIEKDIKIDCKWYTTYTNNYDWNFGLTGFEIKIAHKRYAAIKKVTILSQNGNSFRVELKWRRIIAGSSAKWF